MTTSIPTLSREEVLIRKFRTLRDLQKRYFHGSRHGFPSEESKRQLLLQNKALEHEVDREITSYLSGVDQVDLFP